MNPNPWKNRSLVETQSLTKDDIFAILNRAKELKRLWKGWKDSAEFPHQSLKGKTVVNLFFEPSTRTRSSFELAARRLGAHVLNFDPKNSSVSKGETLAETARNLEAMDPDVLILRHQSAGATQLLSRAVKIPVINAGDGFHEHPTQALLDAMTILESRGDFKGVSVLIVGDIAHSRVARSNINLLKTLGAVVSVCGPPSLMPPLIEKLGVSTVYFDLCQALQQADVVMMLRVQTERISGGYTQFPSASEYARFWGLNSETASRLKKDAIIMHPGPYNEGVEISQEVASGPYSVILNQVQNGVLVRMALMDLIAGREVA